MELKQNDINDLTNLYTSLERERDKLQFLQEAFFVMAGSTSKFANYTAEDRNTEILEGLSYILEGSANNVDDVAKKLEEMEITPSTKERG